MELLSAEQIEQALRRLGELAFAQDLQLDMALVGGAVMTLAYHARASTRDVDAIFFSPPDAAQIRQLALQVGLEMNLPQDWLNDGAKGFVVGLELGQTLIATQGITVRQVSAIQLLAMKLSAWRDDTDIQDAKRLLKEIDGSKEEIWSRLESFLSKGDELKAHYAFLDLWESQYAQ